MNKIDIEKLGPAERAAYNTAATWLNELAFMKNVNRRNTGKKVKGKRKKVKQQKKRFDIKQATPLHAFEAILGSLKMETIAYLKVDCTPSEVMGWVYGLNRRGAEIFVNDLREPMCHEILNILGGQYIYRASWDVYKWLFKSGFLKRSNNIFKEHYKDGVNFSYSEDILALKDKYMERGKKIATNTDFEASGMKQNSAALEDEMRFLLRVWSSYEALKIALEDMECDDVTRKRAKYLTTQVKTLGKTIVNFINESTPDFDHTEKAIMEVMENRKVKEYQNTFEPFTELVSLSCVMTGIEFKKENEDWFRSYHESLKSYSDKRLRKELYWLRGVIEKKEETVLKIAA